MVFIHVFLRAEMMELDSSTLSGSSNVSPVVILQGIPAGEEGHVSADPVVPPVGGGTPALNTGSMTTPASTGSLASAATGGVCVPASPLYACTCVTTLLYAVHTQIAFDGFLLFSFE